MIARKKDCKKLADSQINKLKKKKKGLTTL